MGPNEKKLAALEQKLADLGIHKKDLEEKFIKASGRGGQKVNKSSSAVFIRHRQTGLCVKVGKHRSRHLNRFLALRALVEKIAALRTGTDEKQQDHIKKTRKQKLRRKQKTRKKLASSRDTTDA